MRRRIWDAVGFYSYEAIITNYSSAYARMLNIS